MHIILSLQTLLSIVLHNRDDARACIQALDGSVVEGRTLKANYGKIHHNTNTHNHNHTFTVAMNC
jgi:RNA recognition motif-containing protein